MSLSSSDDGSPFTIKSSRLIGAFTLIDYVQSRLTCVDLSFSMRAMKLKILLVDLFKTSVAVWVRKCTARMINIAHFSVGKLLLHHYKSDLAHTSDRYSSVIEM